MKRKIYDKLSDWKNTSNGDTALLIDGARRVGKSYIAESFAKENYKSYILIDFNKANKDVCDLFINYLDDLDTLFMYLSSYYNTKLYKRESAIIFDEVQMFPKARVAIKYLVADARYDYIETGFLMSIRKNVKDITIPSEERHIRMYPMDFEEFCYALGEKNIIKYIRLCFEKQQPLEGDLHHKAMLLFKQYMIVGGMPMSVSKYLENNRSFADSDTEKRDILTLYKNDINKADTKYRSKISAIFEQISAFLSQQEKECDCQTSRENLLSLCITKPFIGLHPQWFVTNVLSVMTPISVYPSTRTETTSNAIWEIRDYW